MVFDACGATVISHHAPLHYLPFIARSRCLKSKPVLRADGFEEHHFRSKSSRSDVNRGFERYAFLTLAKHPRIVNAKLKGGFPHVSIQVPASAFEGVEFDLCRYNVAMTRQLRRNEKPGFEESPTNGRYYDGMQIPIARTREEKTSLLEYHYPRGTMIEVLVNAEMPLPDETVVICYHRDDLTLAQRCTEAADCPWSITVQDPPGDYNRKRAYVAEVEEFIETVLVRPDWRGNGLEFDNV